MVTQTIYTDAYMVVIDIGAVPPTAEWLEETTYLIDSSGHTTAIIAQTDRPTDGITLQPVPYTPAQALISTVPSSTTPPGATTSAPSTTISKPTTTSITFTPKRNTGMTDALVAVGAVLGLLITAIMVYLLRRRSKRKRLDMVSNNISGTDSSSSLNSLEKLIEGTKMRQGTFPQEWNEEGLPSWDEFLKEVEDIYERFDDTTILSSSKASDARSSGGSHPTVSELQEKYNELWRNKHSRSIKQNSNSSNTMVGSPTSKLPPLPKQTLREKSELTERKMAPTQAIGLPSILKRPARKGLVDAVDGIIISSTHDDAAELGSTTNLSQKQGKVKKGVRFGNNEVREFGATPLPSRTNSVI